MSMTPARQALADALKIDGHSGPYLYAIGMASHFSRLGETRINIAKFRGRAAAYADMAARLLMDYPGHGRDDAEKIVRRHVKEWTAATEEDERWLQEAR